MEACYCDARQPCPFCYVNEDDLHDLPLQMQYLVAQPQPMPIEIGYDRQIIQEKPEVLYESKMRAFETFNTDSRKTLLDRHKEYRSLSYTITPRVLEIINQCRYLAQKRGMDRRQLIDSIREDELQGKTHVQAFDHIVVQECVNPWGTSFAKDASWMMGFGEGQDSPECPNYYNYIISDNTNNPCNTFETAMCNSIVNSHGIDNTYSEKSLSRLNEHQYQENSTTHSIDDTVKPIKEENTTIVREKSDSFSDVNPSEVELELECVPIRPPTRRGTSAVKTSPTLPTQDGENLMEDSIADDYDSGESDFDPSETSELLENMKLATLRASCDKTNFAAESYFSDSDPSPSDSIRPMRKPATIDLSIFQIGENGTCFSSKNDTFVSSEPDSYNNESGGEETSRSLLIETARVHACASFVQMRDKLDTIDTAQEPIFGSLDEFRTMLTAKDSK